MQYATIIIRLDAVVSKYQFMPIYFALSASLRDGGVVTQAAIDMRIATSRWMLHAETAMPGAHTLPRDIVQWLVTRPPLPYVGQILGHSQARRHGIMGRRFPDGGLLRYRKWVPQQLGDVVSNSPLIGLMRSQLTNHQVGIVLAVRAWS